MIVELLALGTTMLSAMSDGLGRRWKTARAMRDPDSFIRALHKQGGKERASDFVRSLSPIESGKQSWLTTARNLNELKLRVEWLDALVASFNRKYVVNRRFDSYADPHDPSYGPDTDDLPFFGPPIMPIHSDDPEDWSSVDPDLTRAYEEGVQMVLVDDLIQLVAEDPDAVAAGLGHHEPQLWSWDATRLLVRVHDGTAARRGYWLFVPRPVAISSR